MSQKQGPEGKGEKGEWVNGARRVTVADGAFESLATGLEREGTNDASQFKYHISFVDDGG